MPTIPRLLPAAAFRRVEFFANPDPVIREESGTGDPVVGLSPNFQPVAPKYNADDPNSVVVTSSRRPTPGNADTVYYPPRTATPIDPKTVNRTSSERLRDDLLRQPFDGRDIVLPTQQQLDYYMSPTPKPQINLDDIEGEPRREEDKDRVQKKMQAAAALQRSISRAIEE